MNNLPFSELKFKPSEAPSDDIQQISPPALASYSKASAGLGSLDFFGAQKKGQWLKAALSYGITLPVPFTDITYLVCPHLLFLLCLYCRKSRHHPLM